MRETQQSLRRVRRGPDFVSLSATVRAVVSLRARQCRWCDGEDAAKFFCEAEAAPGASYCEDHRRRMISKTERGPNVYQGTRPLTDEVFEAVAETNAAVEGAGKRLRWPA